jgi:hypothetical protein
MLIKCPNCQHQLANTITFEFLGHKADYWIDLESRAEELNVVELLKENTRLKAKLYNMEVIAGQITEILKK